MKRRHYGPYVGFRADSELFSLLSSLNPQQPGRAAKEIVRLYMALLSAGKADLKRMGREERIELMKAVEGLEIGKQELCDRLIAMQQSPKLRSIPLHVQLALLHTTPARMRRKKK